MNRTEKCFICGRSTENGLDVCPDCFSRLPDCCKEKYTKLTQEEKRLMITSPLWQMRINANEPHKSYGNKLSLYPDKGVLFFSGNYISLENIDNIEFKQKVTNVSKNGKEALVSLDMYATIKTHTPRLSITEKIGVTNFVLKEGENLPFNTYKNLQAQINNWKKPVKVPNMTYYEACTLYMLQTGYTKEDLSKTRKRLLKVFHPDQKGEEDCAKKINMAYDILKTYAK